MVMMVRPGIQQSLQEEENNSFQRGLKPSKAKTNILRAGRRAALILALPLMTAVCTKDNNSDLEIGNTRPLNYLLTI